MDELRLDRLLELITRIEMQVGILWFGLAFLTITMLVLSRTRLGQSKTLRKCVVLSLLAHVLLAGYATTVQIVESSSDAPDEPIVRVTFAEDSIQSETSESTDESPDLVDEVPWENMVDELPTKPEPLDLERVEPVEIPQPERRTQNEQVAVNNEPSLERVPLTESPSPEPESLPDAERIQRTATKSIEKIRAPKPQQREAVRVKFPAGSSLAHRGQPDRSMPDPRRNSQPRVSSARLNQPMPIPRMTDAVKTPNPDKSFTGVDGHLESISSGKPVEWSSESQPSPNEDVSPSVSRPFDPARTKMANIRPPSLALGGVDRQAVGKTTNSTKIGTANVRPAMPPRRHSKSVESVPSPYKLRMAPNRSQLAERLGATTETEEAVRLALRWMANNQSPDGRWNASLHGAGRELKIANIDRSHAGLRADSGITGLALMAFLAAGNTHQTGLYQENVRRGLNFLIQKQTSDGNMSGDATKFAARYCHAMAAIAVCEDYGMTGDSRLESSVRKAVAYTINAQNKSTGGWRYRDGDPGDTSQLGWQLMVLKSASTAGIPISSMTRSRMHRFLQSVSDGKHQGLAAYQPGWQVSRAMTAEALACRQFLGQTGVDAAAREAGDYLLGHLPGEGRPNFYYWYYGTLSMYHLQGDYWERWNKALRTELLASQQTSGTQAGSWNPDTVWGGYGGRVYSTALATLCLEVYYRFLPTYMQASKDGTLQ